MSARSNSEASSNASSPPSSVHISGNSQVINNNNNAPKYGTLVPNRVFVGGIPSNTTEPELCQLFSKYGNVRATKIIADRAGVSKGYGFVTFETEEEAKRLQLDADNITLRERRLNIAPAVKKQPFGRAFESAASPPPTTPSLYYHNGMPYTFHNGMAYFPQAPNQGAAAAAAVPTPEMPTVFQGSGFGPHSNAQSYGPTMMYPCGANPAATMFISPQPYNPYPHMPVPSQGPPPIMYTGGPNPSANQPTNTPTENTQSVQMAAGPPAPYYLPPSIAQTPEIFYNMQAAPSQGCYTPITVTTLPSHDSLVHYCDVSIEQNSNNITPEMQQPLFHQRNYPNHFYPHYSPIHQQAPPAPPTIPAAQLPQTRRYGNGGKKTAANGSSNMHMNARKMKTEGMDCGAAGDGPVPNIMQVSMSSPGTNNKNSTSAASTAQDLCSQVQALSL